MNQAENNDLTNFAFLLALSGRKRSGGGGGAITPSDVRDIVSDYLNSHKATSNAPGIVQIGEGISVDDNGVASIDEEFMAEMIADILNEQTVEISEDEIKNLWD